MQKQTDKQLLNISKIISSKLIDANKPIRLVRNLTYKAVIEAYIEHKSIGWSLGSQESESSRIRAFIPVLEEFKFNAHSIYLNLVSKELSPYTIRTMFVRLKDFAQFCIRTKLVIGDINPFYNYMKFEAPNKFKIANVYKPITLDITFSELKLKLDLDQSLTQIAKDTIIYLLHTGLRISELYKIEQVSGDQWAVKGKGGKYRRVIAQPPQVLLSRDLLRKSLTGYNLTPHDLRRLFATELANKGLTGNQLKQVMGWSSIQTANSYLQATEDELLFNNINELMNKPKDK